MQPEQIRQLAEKVIKNVARVIVGKEAIVERMMIAVICQGHVLLEDVPGMGKTMLAKSIAKSIDCKFRRIQLTPDLLPSDITGIHYYNQKEGDFVFRAGPVFSNLVLADEINRATPRTQSALLECMEERQVTVDGITMILDSPFLVMATQNPIDIQGTFPLPEAQVDRFLMKLKMGYPQTDEGVTILRRFKEQDPVTVLEPVIRREELLDAQRSYSVVHVSDELLGYIVAIAEATRVHPDIMLGVSPRGTQSLLRAVQVLAVLRGRNYAIPDDIKEMALPVLAHRIVVKGALKLKTGMAEELLLGILKKVPVPAEDLMPA
jgi:MoxR-like ATPase